MKTYEIDFKDIKTYSGFYQTIIKSMDFPSWCGDNPSAIWDMITTDIEMPAIIYIKGLDSLSQELQQEKELFLKIVNRTREWYEKLGMHVEIRIED